MPGGPPALADHCRDVTVLGDGAYLNCGMVVPHRKRPRRELLPGEEADNAAHRTVRARVEHVTGRMKNYKILRDCRQHGDGPTTPSKPSPTCTTSPSHHDQKTAYTP